MDSEGQQRKQAASDLSSVGGTEMIVPFPK